MSQHITKKGFSFTDHSGGTYSVTSFNIPKQEVSLTYATAGGPYLTKNLSVADWRKVLNPEVDQNATAADLVGTTFRMADNTDWDITEQDTHNLTIAHKGRKQVLTLDQFNELVEGRHFTILK